MRKRKAVILFGGMSLVVLAYAAWCWRPFFLAPRIRFAPELAAEQRGTLRPWLRSAPEVPPVMRETEEWSWRAARAYLFDLYSDRSGVIDVSRSPREEEIYLAGFYVQGTLRGSLELTEKGGRWEVVRNPGFQSPY